MGEVARVSGSEGVIQLSALLSQPPQSAPSVSPLSQQADSSPIPCGTGEPFYSFLLRKYASTFRTIVPADSTAAAMVTAPTVSRMALVSPI